MRRIISTFTVASVLALGAPGTAEAHTDSDLVAVPAGSEATVTLKPTHGCGDSPTIEVSIRADVAGATPTDVPGWTASATDDGEGRTVVRWVGGSLPSNEIGAFPIRFTAPDSPGELLLFPSVQRCENGEELAWIDGDPTAEFPAPRLLVLPAGFEPAETIDDVPADAPGRDQLVAIVDVDNSNQTTTTPTQPPTTEPATAPAPTTEATTAAPTTPPSTSSPATSSPATTDPSESTVFTDGTQPSDSSDGDASPVLVIGAIAILIAAVAAAIVVVLRRRGSSGVTGTP